MSGGNEELKFSANTIAVVITTYYKEWYQGKIRSIDDTDKVRGDLALELMTIAADRGYEVVVVDGKSSAAFKCALSSISGVHIINRRSPKQSPSRRQGIVKAARLPHVKIVVLTEPEKVPLMQDCIDLTLAPIVAGEADIVVPRRDPALFKATYPSYQYESEIEGNKLYNQILRTHRLLLKGDEELDMFFGPRVFCNKPEIVSFFLNKSRLVKRGATPQDSESRFDPERYSNALYFPIVTALARGYRVQSVMVPFSYPKRQKENEEEGPREFFMEKRRAQRIGLIIELLYFLKDFSRP